MHYTLQDEPLATPPLKAARTAKARRSNVQPPTYSTLQAPAPAGSGPLQAPAPGGSGPLQAPEPTEVDMDLRPLLPVKGVDWGGLHEVKPLDLDPESLRRRFARPRSDDKPPVLAYDLSRPGGAEVGA